MREVKSGHIGVVPGMQLFFRPSGITHNCERVCNSPKVGRAANLDSGRFQARVKMYPTQGQPSWNTEDENDRQSTPNHRLRSDPFDDSGSQRSQRGHPLLGHKGDTHSCQSPTGDVTRSAEAWARWVRQAEAAGPCTAAAVWCDQGHSAAGFRPQSSGRHRPVPTWQLGRQFILICRDAMDLWCGAQRRQTAIR